MIEVGTGMFLNMATVEPLPGKELELFERMHSFAEILKPLPGLVNVFVLREEGTGALVGLSIWKNKESFEHGMETVPNRPPSMPLSKGPPKTRQFLEIHKEDSSDNMSSAV